MQTNMYTPHCIKRDKYKRALLSKRMVPELVHKVVCHDRSSESYSGFNWQAHKKHARVLHHSPKNALRTRITNRCVLSGRSGGVYRFCKLSRIRIRELAGKGLLIGITKASW